MLQKCFFFAINKAHFNSPSCINHIKILILIIIVFAFALPVVTTKSKGLGLKMWMEHVKGLDLMLLKFCQLWSS